MNRITFSRALLTAFILYLGLLIFGSRLGPAALSLPAAVALQPPTPTAGPCDPSDPHSLGWQLYMSDQPLLAGMDPPNQPPPRTVFPLETQRVYAIFRTPCGQSWPQQVTAMVQIRDRNGGIQFESDSHIVARNQWKMVAWEMPAGETISPTGSPYDTTVFWFDQGQITNAIQATWEIADIPTPTATAVASTTATVALTPTHTPSLVPTQAATATATPVGTPVPALRFDRPAYYTTNDVAIIEVIDIRHNLNDAIQENINVHVRSQTRPALPGLLLPLAETDVNTGVFRGILGFSLLGSDSRQRRIHVSDGDWVQAIFENLQAEVRWYAGTPTPTVSPTPTPLPTHTPTATPSLTPTPTLTPTPPVWVAFDREVYQTEQDVAILTVLDPSQNFDPGLAEHVQIFILSASDPRGIIVLAQETDVNAGFFSTDVAGKNLTFCSTCEQSDQGNATIKVNDRDLITAFYSDAEHPECCRDTAVWYRAQPSFTFTPTVSPTPTLSATPTYTPAATHTPTTSPTPSLTPSPSATPTLAVRSPTPSPTLPPDTEPPAGTVVINLGPATQQGALYTTSPLVRLALLASDNQSGVTHYRTSIDGVNFSAWLTYAPEVDADLGSGDGQKVIYVQYRDGAGNLSPIYTDTILLDTTVGSNFGLSINDGALWTNSSLVALKIPAQAGTAEMQISNDGGFIDAVWEPYALYKNWQITAFDTTVLPRTVYVRFRDTRGDSLVTSQDDIILDVVAPHSEIVELKLTGDGMVQANAGRSSTEGHVVPVLVRWAGTDNVSGIRWYEIQVRTDEEAWRDWLLQTIATEAYFEARPGHMYYFRSRAQDNAGNWEAYTSDNQVPGIHIRSVHLPALLRSGR